MAAVALVPVTPLSVGDWCLVMAAKTSEFEQEMQQLEAEMKRLEAEYNMFFAGRLPRLPWETRARVDALVKRYDRMALPQHRAAIPLRHTAVALRQVLRVMGRER